MLFTSWLRRTKQQFQCARPVARGGKPRRRACRPAVEILEDRVVPAARLFAIPPGSVIHELNPTTGAIINTIPAPEPTTSGANGLAFDGSRLFFINGGGSDRLYELNPNTGAVLDNDLITTGSGNYDGLAVVAGKVYIQDPNADRIYEFDPANDTITNTLNPGTDLLGGLTGASNPGALIGPILGGNLIAEINPATGAITNTFQPGFPTLLGAAYVGNEIYLGSGGGSGAIFRYSRTGTFLGQLSTGFPIAALASDDTTTGTPPAPGPQFVNGDFEAGSVAGWTVFNQQPVGAGSLGFQAFTGPNPLGSQLPAPPQGNFAAFANHSNAGTYILYQDVSLPVGQFHTLSLQVFYNNFGPDFITPNTLNFSPGPNQQYRIDVITPGGDLLSTDSTVVLQNVFRTDPGEPRFLAPTLVTADLSAFAGQTVRLRIAVVATVAQLYGAVDDVKITSSGTAPTGSVAGVKFHDLDGDGVRDPGEPGLPGWTIYADVNNNRQLDPGEPSAVTDPTGAYTVVVPPGTHTFREVAQAGWVQTAPASDRLFSARIGTGGGPQIIAEHSASGALLNSFNGPTNVSVQGPQGLAYSGDSLFYINGAQGSGTVGPHTLFELDPATGAVLDSDVLPASPEIDGVAYLGGRVYMQVHLTNQVMVFDPTTDTLIRTLTIGGVDIRGGLTGAADLGLLFATTLTGQIVAINPQTGAIVRTLLPGIGVVTGGLAYFGGVLFASNGSPNVSRIDPQTGAVLGTTNLIAPPGGSVVGLAGEGRVPGGQRLAVAANQTVGLNLGNRRDEGTVSGVKFNDQDGDGTRDVGEPGLPGWTIYADLNNNRRLDAGEPSTLTGPTGAYTLIVPSGIHAIREVVQAGWIQTAPFSTTLYSAAFGGQQLATINPATGAATPIGPFGTPPEQIFSITTAPDGSLWTVIDPFDLTNARLARVDPANGLATPVGGAMGTNSPIRALEADAAGKLYAATSSGQFYQVNTTTGAATLIGFLGFPEVADLAFDPAGGLWALRFSNQLYRIEPTTGQSAFVANITGFGGSLYGLSIHPATGVFYLTTTANLLYTVDPATGVATPVGPTQAPVFFGSDFAVENGHAVTITPGVALPGRDFGNQRNEGVVRGVKYEDLDGDGTRDGNEPGLPNWTIYADLNNNGRPDAGEPSAITGPDGSYELTLPAGTHAIREVPQAGWVQTGPGDDRLFALRPTSGQTLNIYELDSFGFIVNTFPAPAPVSSFGLQGLAVGRNSIFYIDGSPVTHGIRTLYELDSFTGAVIDSDVVQLANGAVSGLAYLDGMVYLLNHTTNQILAFNPVTDTVVRTLAPQTGTLFGGLTGAADLGLLFANMSGQIAAIDPVSGAVVRTLAPPGVGQFSGGLAYRAGELIGVALSTTSQPIFRIDPVTGAVLGAIGPLGSNISGLGGDGPHPGALRVTIAAGSLLTGRNFGNQRIAAPVANDDAATVGEDNTLAVPAPGVLANDTGALGAQAVTAVNGSAAAVGQLITLPSGSRLRLNSDGSYTYTPAGFQHLRSGQSATDAFTYRMTDGTGATATATVLVTIIGANGAPVAQPDTAVTTEDNAVSGNVLLNDLDEDAGDTRSVVAVNGNPAQVGQSIALASGARVILRANGTFDYLPSGAWDQLAVGQTAQDQFAYTMADAAGATSSATVTVQVNGVNDVPVAVDFAVEVGEDGHPVTGVFQATDAEPGPLTFQVLTSPAGGVVINNNNGTFIFDPAADFHDLPVGGQRTVTFTYQASDAAGGISAPATVTIVVTGVNDEPIAVNDTGTTNEDTVLQVAAPGILGNDLDVDAGDTHTVTAVNGNPAVVGQPLTLPSGAVVTVRADGSYTYNPNGKFEALGPGQTATDAFSYTLTDSQGDSSSGIVTVTITGVNDIPVAENVTVTVSEDGPSVNGAFLATDDEPGPLTFTVLTPPAGGQVINNNNGTFTFAPGAAFHDLPAGGQRTVTFTYQASDTAGGISAPATVTVVVTGVNDQPIAVNDTGTTNEDTVLQVAAPGILGNDTDVDAGDTHTVAAVNGNPNAVGQPVTLASGAVVTVRADGSYTYNPNGKFEALGPGQAATDTFAYSVADALGAMSQAIVTITITGVNDTPVANADAYETNEDTALIIPAAGVLANDTDVDGGTLTAALLNGPTNGTATVNPNGSFTYQPKANFNGTDTFTYTVPDGRGGTAIGMVTIRVLPVNDVPVAEDLAVEVGEDGHPVTGVFQATDVEPGPLTFQVLTPPAGGVVINNGNGTFTFDPAGDFHDLPVGGQRTVTFTYQASDAAGGISAPATVTVVVTGVNDEPIAVNDVGTTNEDTVLQVVAPGILGNDLDVDAGDTHAVTAVNGNPAVVGQPLTLPSGAVVTVRADGGYTYNPNGKFETLGPGQTATDTFAYTVTDAQGDSSSGIVTITIVGVNDAPVANADAYETNEDTALIIPAAGVLANDTDVDGGTLTAALLNGPTNGTATVNPNGSFTYQPKANFNGTDTFTYTVSDGRGGTAIGMVTIRVLPVNDAPTLGAATFRLPENSPNGTIVGTATGADVDGDTLQYRIVGGNTGGAFAIDLATGRITVANVAMLDFETTPRFNLTVEVRDPGGLAATATITVELTNVSESPRIDIEPGDSRNRINHRSGARVSVAILSSSDFDARLVDINSLRFGRTGQEDSLSRHPKHGPRYRFEDVNGDGRLDLVAEFEIEKTGFRPGDTRGILTGRLLNGLAFSAEDMVSIH